MASRDHRNVTVWHDERTAPLRCAALHACVGTHSPHTHYADGDPAALDALPHPQIPAGCLVRERMDRACGSAREQGCLLYCTVQYNAVHTAPATKHRRMAMKFIVASATRQASQAAKENKQSSLAQRLTPVGRH